MEQTKHDGLSGALEEQPAPAGELFWAGRPDGTRLPLREVGDAELAGLVAMLQQQSHQANLQIGAALQQATQIHQCLGAAQFELERRAKSLVIARAMPH